MTSSKPPIDPEQFTKLLEEMQKTPIGEQLNKLLQNVQKNPTAEQLTKLLQDAQQGPLGEQLAKFTQELQNNPMSQWLMRFMRIKERYTLHFASKPMLTRQPKIINNLISELSQLSLDAHKLPTDSRKLLPDKFQQEVNAQLKLYKDTRVQIVQQQRNAGKDGIRLVSLIHAAECQMHRYQRHFSSKPRPTRDLQLLQEICAELDNICVQMKSNVKPVEGVQVVEFLKLAGNNSDSMRQEITHIREARNSLNPEQYASALAQAANERFKTYNTLIAEKTRATRRPQLLQGLIADLNTLQQAMSALLEGGYDHEENTKNITVVQQEISNWQGELQLIEQAQQQLRPNELARRLTEEARTLRETWQKLTGELLISNPLEKLAAHADLTFELYWQLKDLYLSAVIPADHNGLGLACDMLMETQNLIVTMTTQANSQNTNTAQADETKA